MIKPQPAYKTGFSGFSGVSGYSGVFARTGNVSGSFGSCICADFSSM